MPGYNKAALLMLNVSSFSAFCFHILPFQCCCGVPAPSGLCIISNIHHHPTLIVATSENICNINETSFEQFEKLREALPSHCSAKC